MSHSSRWRAGTRRTKHLAARRRRAIRRMHTPIAARRWYP